MFKVFKIFQYRPKFSNLGGWGCRDGRGGWDGWGGWGGWGGSHVVYIEVKCQLRELKKEGHFHYKNFLCALKWVPTW